MILIDTNVLLRAAQTAHSHHAAALHALKTVRLRGYTPSIVPQIIYEYWVVATRPIDNNGLGMTTPAAETEVVRLLKQFHLLRDERAILERWQGLVLQYDVQGKTAHDARLVAAMNRHGIQHLLTFNDQHFKRFQSIEIHHPNDIENLDPAENSL